MKDHKTNDGVETLLQIAGKRIAPSKQMKNEVYANVHKVWTQQNKKPVYFNRYFLAAASLFILVGIYTINMLPVESNGSLYLNISKKIVISGQIETSQDQNNWSYLKTDSVIQSGDYIRTNKNNRILVELINGNIFKLDENSLIKVANMEELELLKGQIYVESNEHNNNNKLLINTKLGSINHIGTQYNVKLEAESINISVRKGAVLIHNDDLDKEINKGFEISINENGEHQKSSIDAFDSKWQWTQVITQEYDIQDKTISQYLKWISNETGYPIVWDSNKSKNLSSTIKLSGSIKGLTPIESLQVILPTTTFNYNISETAIHISD